MKKIKFLGLFLTAALLFSFAGCGGTGNEGGRPSGTTQTDEGTFEQDGITGSFYNVSSPDGSIVLRADLLGGKAYFSVQKDKKQVVEQSGLGIAAEGNSFTKNLSFRESKRASSEVSYDVVSGKKSHVETSYNELTLSFDGKYDMTLELVFRAYNDGYAFRYCLKQDGGELVAINEETTNFTLPENTSKVYVTTTPDYETRFCYEEPYLRKRIDNVNGLISGMPVLYEVNGVWSMITESELIGSDYRGSFLEGTETGFKIEPAYTRTDTLMTDLPFNSPWRVGVVGDLGTMVESTLVEDVYGETEYWRPDNYDELSPEEQAIYTYDWVETPKSGFSWLQLGSGTQKQWEDQRKYIKNAHDQGWDWFLIDAGWVPVGQTEMNSFLSLMQYAKDLGVHMICWAHSYEALGTPALRETNIKQWREWGFEGLKIDFFDGLYDTTNSPGYGESQYTLRLYEEIYQITAKYQMIVCCHGANKPTGERRIYPHVISREGIRGGEYKKNIDIKDCITFVYSRASVGPNDWILSIKPFGKNTTAGSQLAIHLAYETGYMIYGDSPENYAQYADATAFLNEIPVVFDDIKYFSGEPQASCVLGREKDGVWYVCGMSVDAGEMEVDLSTVCDPNKEYDVTILSDGETYLDLVKTTKTVKGDEVLKIGVLKNGGFVLSIKEK